MRISGVEIPDHERVCYGIQKIFGIGDSNVYPLLKLAKIEPNKRVRDLNKDEVASIMKALEEFKTEGDLRKEIRENIERLKAIRSYRGYRHMASLPARGQRTRSNSRTRKGKKKTVGSLTKEAWAKIEAAQTATKAKTSTTK